MIFPAETDWDDAYTNGAYIAGGDQYPARWSEPAQRFRDRIESLGSARLDLAYGPLPRNRLDLFPPRTPPRGLFIFVHGGYWMKFDKSVDELLYQVQNDKDLLGRRWAMSELQQKAAGAKRGDP